MTPHPRRPRVARWALLSALVALLAACGDSSGPRVPAQVTVVAGDQQSVPVGEGAGLPLQVRVSTEGGQPVSGEEVVWAVTSGAAQVDPDTTGTDANGVATTTVRMGQTAGPVTITATVRMLAPATFTLTGAPGAATTAAVVSGSNQAGTVGQPLAEPVVVEARDAFQNPVPGATVVFEPLSGNGTVAQAQVVTDAQGRASTTWTLGGSPGEQRLNARIQGAAALTVFRANATAGAPASLVKVSGDNQQAAPGDTLGQPLVVRVDDVFGNPVSNAAVSFSASHGGSFTPAQATTNAQGQAQVRWILGPTPDTVMTTQTATASAAGAGSVMFTAVAFDPCGNVASYTIGQTVMGRLESGDCQIPELFGDDTYFDIFNLDIQQQGIFDVSLSSTAWDPFLLMFPTNAQAGGAAGGAPAVLRLVAEPAEYLLLVNQFTRTDGDYTLSSSTRQELVDGCETFWIAGSITVSSTITSQDCSPALSGLGNFDGFGSAYFEGDSISLTMSSDAFDPVLILGALSSGQCCTIVAADTGVVGQTPATIELGVSQTNVYVAFVNATNPQSSGAYTFSVDVVPSAQLVTGGDGSSDPGAARRVMEARMLSPFLLRMPFSSDRVRLMPSGTSAQPLR